MFDTGAVAKLPGGGGVIKGTTCNVCEVTD